MKHNFTYTEENTREISFPLGGIGAGCVGLAGNGALIDWEIFNNANKESRNGLSHFAVRAEKSGKVIDTRILQGDYLRDYSGEKIGGKFRGFGWGPRRENLAAMPHFSEHTFSGEFPVAEVSFTESVFPGKPVLHAWSPHIPLNSHDSSLPAAIFEIEITNDTDDDLDYTVFGALSNPFGNGNTRNTVRAVGALKQLYLTRADGDPAAFDYGDICLSTFAEDVSHQSYFYRGAWCDSLQVYWDDICRGGRLADRDYPEPGPQGAWEGCDTGVLAAHCSVSAGTTAAVRFVLSWNVPNRRNDWDSRADELSAKNGVANRWKNWYATQWEDSAASGRYVLDNIERLYADTAKYRAALYNSTLPAPALEAAAATVSVLKTPTVLRLEDGTFYGWEGIGMDWGSCEGSCTHVWNYAQAQAFQFPGLERSMRSANYTYSVDEDGGSHFRIKLPLGIHAEKDFFRPCADGQFGDVMKTYRDWKLSGDDDWLKSIYPALKKTMEFAWSPANPDQWDPQKTGVLWGRQHHTLDMELFGPNSWLTGFYLGALKAASRMAGHLGDRTFAEECAELFNKGKLWTDKNLFNGEYYIQQIDLTDKAILEKFLTPDDKTIGRGRNVIDSYWDAEHGQIKYQIQDGCFVNQVIAQWFADLYGLGEIFDPAKVKSALKAIHKYNFYASVRNLANPWRCYVFNDEGGTIDCAWPETTVKPAIPLPYDSETQAGYEYAAVIHMIGAGLEAEGMDGVKAIRDRYDGAKRNPWNEIECGNNYARSMAAFALINTYSGMIFDTGSGFIGFAPLRSERPFKSFWIAGTAWGSIEYDTHQVSLKVDYGCLELQALDFGIVPKSISIDGIAPKYKLEGHRMELERKVRVKAGITAAI